MKGYCSKGQGCVCHEGFTGINCEIPQSTLEMKKIMTTHLPTYSNEIMKFYATSKNKLSLKPTINTKQPPKTTRKMLLKSPLRSDKPKLDCKNGGFFIDDMCLCINSYTGVTCEISPAITTATKMQSISGDTVFLNLIDDAKSELHKSTDIQVKPQQQAKDNDFTYITFNRAGRRGKNFIH